jgi:multidrug efflux pump subunit AcrB
MQYTFTVALELIRDRYADLLGKLLKNTRKRRILLGGVAVVLVVVLLLPIFQLVLFRMLPKADKEQFVIYLDRRQTTPVEQTLETVQEIEEFLLSEEDILSVQSYVGRPQVVDLNGLFRGSDGRNQEHQATLKVNLTHPSERNRTSEQIVLELRPIVLELLNNMPDATLTFVEEPPGPPVRSTYFVKIHGPDSTARSMLTREVFARSQDIDGVVGLRTSLDESGYEEVFKINKEKAAQLGVRSHDIAATLSTALEGKTVGLYHEALSQEMEVIEETLLVVRLKEEQRDSLDDLGLLSVLSANGSRVSLAQLLVRADASAAAPIYSDGRQQTDYVMAETGKRSIVYASIDLLTSLVQNGEVAERLSLQSWNLYDATFMDTQTGEEYIISLDGEWRLTLEVFTDMGIAFSVAFVAIFIVLAVQFQSIRASLLIMASLAFSLLGVLPGFAILGATIGTYFNATSMIGVIALAGIVVNNAIILLEYLKQKQAQYDTLADALVETGRTRFTPILLTTLTTMLGSLTIISDPVWEGLAWSIVWGLGVSSAMTLIVFPLLYFELFKNGEKKTGVVNNY